MGADGPSGVRRFAVALAAVAVLSATGLATAVPDASIRTAGVPPAAQAGDSPAGTDPVLTVEDATVAPEATTNATVAIERVPAAFVSYSITIAVANATTASIADVTYNGDLGYATRDPAVDPDRDAVTVAAANLAGRPDDPGSTVALFAVTVRGEAPGRTSLAVRNASVENIDGEAIDLAVRDGRVVVRSPGRLGRASTALLLATGLVLAAAGVIAIGRYRSGS